MIILRFPYHAAQIHFNDSTLLNIHTKTRKIYVKGVPTVWKFFPHKKESSSQVALELLVLKFETKTPTSDIFLVESFDLV